MKLADVAFGGDTRQPTIAMPSMGISRRCTTSVMKWKREQRAWKSAGLALKIQGDTTSMRVEPFAVVIRSTSDPAKVDAKTRSKWSRALRAAEAFKGRDTSIKAFVKGLGGINKCAATVRKISEKRQ